MATIELDIAAFRTAIDAFADTTQYPDALITSEWAKATCYISDSTFGRLSVACRTLAIQLMTAHILNLRDLVNSGAPSGQITGASEDGVSISLTPPTSRNQWQYWFNITPYGQQILPLLSKAYVGGAYVGGSPERQAFRKIGSRF